MLRVGIRLQHALSRAWTTAPPRKPRPAVLRGAGAEAIAPGRFLAGSYRNAAGSRHYKVYAPATSGIASLPLVVMLHGCAQHPDDFAAGTRMNELAEELRFVALYPAQSSRANRARCWNWFEALHQRRDQGEPSLIAGITRKILRSGLDRRRVYIAGLSAGGAMAAVMASEYPDLYAAAGIHSGLRHGAAQDLLSAMAAMRGARGAMSQRPRAGPTIPIITFHGDSDTTVHPSNSDFAEPVGGRVVAEHGVRNGRSFTRRTHLDPLDRPMAEQWTLHGAGHAWSGGDRRGSFADPSGPDASREMLRFFLLHSRSQPG